MSRLACCSLVLLAVAAACGDNTGGQPDARVDSVPEPDGGIPSPGVGLAVVNSDYTSTSISLLDRRTGQVTNGNCINSGTQTPNNTLALSGDVVLPSQPQAMDLLVTIDRTNGALTWIDPSTCDPLRQLDVSTGFYANPHDVTSVSPTKAYVTRYELNSTPTNEPSDLDEGDDILIIDPSAPAIKGRIPMASYATTVPNVTIQARPDRALRVGDKVYVVLQNLSANFQNAGPGRIVVLDTTTDTVSGTIDIPTLNNCGSLSYVETTKTLVVGCTGRYGDPDQLASSGIAYIDTGASPPALARTQPATPFGRPLASYSGIARDGALGFGVTPGEFMAQPTDQFWSFDVAPGTATKLDDSSDSFTFGTVLVDPSRDRVYLTDANAAEPRVHILGYGGGGTPTLETSVNANPGVGLPPRQIAWY